MSANRMLVVCESSAEFESFSRCLGSAWPGRICGLLDVDDLQAVLETPDVGLVLVLSTGEASLPTLSRSLWHTSRSPHRVPIVLVTRDYDPSMALAAFRMGAADYVSLHAHGERLGKILATLIGIDADEEDESGSPRGASTDAGPVAEAMAETFSLESRQSRPLRFRVGEPRKAPGCAASPTQDRSSPSTGLP